MDVREHPAPSGALRLMNPRHSSATNRTSQGPTSTIRCIKTGPGQGARHHHDHRGQGASSTIRCIKTRRRPCTRRFPCRVREHPAPPGALRRNTPVIRDADYCVVRERPAPSGALKRARAVVPHRPHRPRQGAPSTIRCIKTPARQRSRRSRQWTVREHPAPSGALRRSRRQSSH